MAVSQELSVPINTKFGYSMSGGVPYHLGGIIFMLMTSWGVHRCTENGVRAPRVHILLISCPQHTETKESYKLECP